MTPEIEREITWKVRSGFYSKEDLLETICEDIDDESESDPAEVEAAIDAAWSQWIAEQESWPPETDCNRLDRVFDALNQKGVIALQNAGVTQSDGYSDVYEIYKQSPHPESVAGYCFYHAQDLERAVEGIGLFLAFGPMDSKKEETDGPAVGRIIVGELAKEGLEVKWNGTFSQRIHVPRIDWKRRVSEE